MTALDRRIARLEAREGDGARRGRIAFQDWGETEETAIERMVAESGPVQENDQVIVVHFVESDGNGNPAHDPAQDGSASR